MSNYTLLADAARDFIHGQYRPCNYQYGEFESSDGHLSITLRFKCTLECWDMVRTYQAPQGVQVSMVTTDGKEGIIYFNEQPK